MTILWRGSKRELMRRIREIPKVIAGAAADPGYAEQFKTAIGFAALTDVKEAFIEKSRGGTDEMGISWEPLKPSTIASRRVGAGDRRNETIARRERIRKREEDKAFKRFRLSLPVNEARRRARIVGSLAATRETGKTKVDTLGGRDVEILRDTSRLFNSLIPGEFDGEVRTPPSGSGAEDQIFDIGVDIRVGTNVDYASAHQNGTSRIPARPFLPDETYPVPAVWFSRWVAVGNQVLANILQRVLAR